MPARAASPTATGLSTLTRPAYAKLNLLLSVGDALPADSPTPGYHPIQSWFHAIDLADTVHLERLPDGKAPSSYTIAWADDAPRPSPIDWPIEKDLACRAHRALEAAVGRSLPVALTLTKRIPVGGGLGGGSADAGATLLALRALFGLQDMDDARLSDIARTLGSDVPFFVDDDADAPTPHAPRPGLVSGLGEQVERSERLSWPIVLVVPPFGCATPAVYQAFDQRRQRERDEEQMERSLRSSPGRAKQTTPRQQLVEGRVEKMLRKGELDTGLLINDLAKPAYEVEPRLGALATALANACHTRCHLTGSGSCLFLVPEGGKTAARKLEKMLHDAQRVLDAFAQDPAMGRCVLWTTRLV